MKIHAFFVFCLMQVLWVGTFAQAISRASFGENCSKEIRCESRSFLSCSNGQCDCLMSDTMVFDENLGKCLTLAGERCQYSTVDGESTWTEELPCISNAQCQNGVCECLPDFFEISNGTCQPKRLYGEECLTNEMCDNSKHLVCGSQQQCICGPDRYLNKDHCVLKAGERCRFGDNCTDHSYCLPKPGEHVTTCTCLKTYFQTEKGTCEAKGALGGLCTEDTHCLEYIPYPGGSGEIPSFLVCLEGKCQCNKRITMVDSQNLYRYCGKNLGELCRDYECQSGAHCSSGICQCQVDEYFQTENKTCEARRSHNQPCTKNNECQNNLVCSRNRCRCPARYEFSPSSKSCALGADQRCKNDGYSSSSQETCIDNAICDARGSSYYEPYYCKCAENFVRSVFLNDGYCYIPENGQCNGDTLGLMTTLPCLKGLVCRDATCTCLYKDHQIFHSDKEVCLSLLGGPCNETIDCSDENAECMAKGKIKQCTCKSGYTRVGRTCDKAYGEKCEHGVNKLKCDRYGPLECSVREICECSDFQIYDKKSLKCKGLVGAKCKLIPTTVDGGVEDDFCVGGSTCQPFRGFRKDYGLCACPSGWETESNRTCTETTSAATTIQTILGSVLDFEVPQADEVPNNELV